MFSYRHAFHAGNHADVLKHAILVHILEHMNQKPAPYWVVDTHAGAGVYDLGGEWSQKKAEYETGIARLYPFAESMTQAPGNAAPVAEAPTNRTPEIIQRYIDAVRALNTPGELRYYPGSPWLALHAMREDDRLRLFELHPSEVDVLQQALSRTFRGRGRQINVKQMDGFDAVRAVLPPPTRRAVVVIDPSYEDKQDYRRVIDAVQEGLQRFATGCFAIWYPGATRRRRYPDPPSRTSGYCVAPCHAEGQQTRFRWIWHARKRNVCGEPAVDASFCSRRSAALAGRQARPGSTCRPYA